MLSYSDSMPTNPCTPRLRSWPFEEAGKLLARVKAMGGESRPVIFETGYGPSGLPHIGTFGEVVRTAMVRYAFEFLTDGKIQTRLICFSDDMDGMRKVPGSVPNQEMLQSHLGLPLSRVPNPFGDEYPSFAHHNNARMCRFLDRFSFSYEFASASQYYREGRFDEMLQRMLERYEQVMNVVLPTLGEERRLTYSPFLPLHPDTGVVMQVPVEERDVAGGAIVWSDPETGKRYKTLVTGGHCKAQWKADWALRWSALGIDYEMSGKDLVDSVKLSTRICQILGARPPETFHYELFLDGDGQKISKSKGNGLTIDDWLRYAPVESLTLFMYQAPRKAKRLYFDVIPRHVDDYFSFLEAYGRAAKDEQMDNPVWHIHHGNPPLLNVPFSFAMLLNLVSASNAQDRAVLWGFISRYAPDVLPETHPELDALVDHAISYFHDFVLPTKVYRLPDERERAALEELQRKLSDLPADADAESLQTLVYEIGKGHKFENLRDWFRTLYEVLLGQSQGPRFGSFIALYGKENSCSLISQALSGALLTSK